MKKLSIWFIGAALLNASILGAQENLFISELADPLDDYSGRFIELYNAGTDAIDFSNNVFFLARQSNGGSTWGEVQLSGSIEPGETYLIGGSGFSVIYGFEPDLVTGILTGNGDDPYYLFIGGGHEEGMIHDIFGAQDTDGSGEAWEYTDSRAVRKDSLNLACSSWQADEWIITTANTADCDPGIHEISIGDAEEPESLLSGLYLQNDTVPLGTSLIIPVMTEELDNEDNIISYQFNLLYDTSNLAYEGYLTENTLSFDGTLAVNASSPGILKISFMTVNPLEGAGTLIELSFSTIATDTSYLFLNNAYLNNSALDSSSMAEILITEITPPYGRIVLNKNEFRYADTVQIQARFNEAMLADTNVSLTFTGAVEAEELIMIRINDTLYYYEYPVPKDSGTVYLNFTGGLDLSGNLLVSEPTEGNSFSIITFVPGDVNDDGTILAYDAALALQYSVGMDPLPDTDPLPWEPWRDSTANVDGLTGITAYDAALILQYSAGLISSFDSNSKKAWSFANVSFEIKDNLLKIYSEGELYGLNIIMDNTDNILDKPVFINEAYIAAYRVESKEYAIGIASARVPDEQTCLLQIPIRKKSNKTRIFKMYINGLYSEKELDLTTGDIQQKNGGIKLFPNPASDIIQLESPTIISNIEILNIRGQVLKTDSPGNNKVSIDITSLPEGSYILRVKQEDRLYNFNLIKK